MEPTWQQHREAGLLPHLKQALRMHTMLQEAEVSKQSALAALDQVREGVLLVDADLRIRFANAEATRLLRAGDGLKQIGSKLAAAQRSDHARLQRAVMLAAQGAPFPTALAVSRGTALPSLLLRVVPIGEQARACLGCDAGAFDISAVVFVGDPEAARIDPALVAGALALTRAEAEVASLLVSGLGIDAVIARLRISKATVRTHLRNIYAKTQTTQQSQLVALVSVIPRPAAQ